MGELYVGVSVVALVMAMYASRRSSLCSAVSEVFVFKMARGVSSSSSCSLSLPVMESHGSRSAACYLIPNLRKTQNKIPISGSASRQIVLLSWQD